MPFVARIKSSGDRVCIEDYDRPKADLPAGDLVCQFEDCAHPMIVRGGSIVRPHFAHRAASPCQTSYESHPESAEHRAGKRAIATFLRGDLARRGYDMSRIRVEFEVQIPEARRVADVLVTFPGGMREAHECQLSPISIADLDRRTTAYLASGIDPIWWLGIGFPADTRTNRDWLRIHCDDVPLLEFVEGDGRVLFDEARDQGAVREHP